jgi:hypothetical protein
MRSLPTDHRLVHPSPIEVGAEGRGELVDLEIHLFVLNGEAEAPVLVLHLTVHGYEHRVDQ